MATRGGRYVALMVGRYEKLLVSWRVLWLVDGQVFACCNMRLLLALTGAGLESLFEPRQGAPQASSMVDVAQ